MEFNQLIPELTVFDIAASKQFYCQVLGFTIAYERIEDGFVFLSKDGNQLMLEQYHDDGWNVGSMEYPLGQGMNLSMEVADVTALYHQVLEKGVTCFRPLSQTGYQVGDELMVQSEFLIQDPNGYILRFIGERSEWPEIHISMVMEDYFADISSYFDGMIIFPSISISDRYNQ